MLKISNVKIGKNHIFLIIDGNDRNYRIKRKMVKQDIANWNKRMIFIEPKLPIETFKALAVHEAVEKYLMTEKKLTYDEAHRIATQLEHKYLLR